MSFDCTRRQPELEDSSNIDEEKLGEIGAPADVQQIYHVTWDPVKQQLTGLPDAWQAIIPQSELSKISAFDLPAHLAPTASEDINANRKTAMSEICSKSNRELVMSELDELPPPGLRVFPNIHHRLNNLTIGSYLVSLGVNLNMEGTVGSLRNVLLEALGTKPVSQLIKLPREIKNMIFSFLDAKSFLATCFTCSALAASIDEPSIWKSLTIAKALSQGTLHQYFKVRSRNWKSTYKSLAKIEKTHYRFHDAVWNVVVFECGVGRGARVGEDRIVGRLGRKWRHLCYLELESPVPGTYRFGFDFVIRKAVFEEKIIQLQIWNGRAQDQMNEAELIIFVFDTTSRETFTRAKELVKRAFRPNKHIAKLGVIIGKTNNMDDEKREVKMEEAKKFGNFSGVSYVEMDIDDATQIDLHLTQLIQKFGESYGFQEDIVMNDQKCLVM